MVTLPVDEAPLLLGMGSPQQEDHPWQWELIRSMTLSVKVSQPRWAWEWAMPACTVSTVLSSSTPEWPRTPDNRDRV